MTNTTPTITTRHDWSTPDEEHTTVTITLTADQTHLLHTILDVIRDDNDDINPCVPFADTLYTALENAPRWK